MSDEIFLIDTNSFITPYLNYYPFDFAPGFWEQMKQFIKNGRIVLLDMVKAEVLQGKDSLSDWMDGLEVGKLIDHREPAILAQYAAVLQHIQENPCYRAAALTEWARGTVADAWLIATASAYSCTIITFEGPNNGLNPATPSKKAKIPDVARAFEVKTENLFYMMRELGFSLR